jgi:hypothetical protein
LALGDLSINFSRSSRKAPPLLGHPEDPPAIAVYDLLHEPKPLHEL